MNVKNTRLSVVTVCRNAGRLLPRALDSVLAQNPDGLEYIVVDGASTDGTVDLLRRYEPRFAEAGIAFRWGSEPDGGIYDAMNKGVSQCRGAIVGILNSDDFYEPGAVAAVLDTAECYPCAGVYYGFLRIIMENGKELQTYRYRFENYLGDPKSGVFSSVQHPACFVRKSVYEKLGLFDANFPIAADYDFLLRAYLAGTAFCPVDRVLSNFSRGGVSDRMSDLERFQQRDAILHKNGLIDDFEFRRRKRSHKYTWYKGLKKQIASRILR